VRSDHGKQGQDDEEPDLGVERKGLQYGAEKVIGVGKDGDGVALDGAELVIRLALPWRLPPGPAPTDIPGMAIGRCDALLPHGLCLPGARPDVALVERVT
jgi:hypothetical protein